MDSTNNKFLKGFIFTSLGIALFILSLYSFGFFGQGGSREFKKEYGEDINPTNLYSYVSKEEVLDFLEKGTGILYIGYPEDSECRKAVSILNDAAFANGISEIKYYNIKKDRDTVTIDENGNQITEKNATNFYKELLKYLKGHTEKYIVKDKDGNEVDTGEYRIYVPYVVFVKNGKIEYAHSDTVDSYDEDEDCLNEEQKNELTSIYETGISLIKETLK